MLLEVPWFGVVLRCFVMTCFVVEIPTRETQYFMIGHLWA